MGSGDLEWEGVQQQKAEFAEIVTRIIERAVASGAVRGDLTYADFPLLTRGVMATMYFKTLGVPGGAATSNSSLTASAPLRRHEGSADGTADEGVSLSGRFFGRAVPVHLARRRVRQECVSSSDAAAVCRHRRLGAGVRSGRSLRAPCALTMGAQGESEQKALKLFRLTVRFW